MRVVLGEHERPVIQGAAQAVAEGLGVLRRLQDRALGEPVET